MSGYVLSRYFSSRNYILAPYHQYKNVRITVVLKFFSISTGDMRYNTFCFMIDSVSFPITPTCYKVFAFEYMFRQYILPTTLPVYIDIETYFVVHLYNFNMSSLHI